MSRIFSVRINLDDMSAQLDALDTDAEKIQWLAGFRAGSRGADVHPLWPQAKQIGAAFGLQAYQHALKLSAQQSLKGKQRNMGEYNRQRLAAQPDSSRGSAAAQPDSSRVPAISNNPIIHISKNPKDPGIQGSTAAQPQSTPPPDFFDGMDLDETEIVPVAPLKLELNWRDWRSQHGAVFVARSGEDGDHVAWEAAWRIYGQACFDGMYAALKDQVPRIYYNIAITWLETNTSETA